MSEEPSNLDIMRELGAITATLDGVRRELDVGRDSRARIHAKLEEHGSRLDKIDNAIEMQAMISGQTREVLKELANQQISFDLDDGVSVNYAKFEGAVATI